MRNLLSLFMVLIMSVSSFGSWYSEAATKKTAAHSSWYSCSNTKLSTDTKYNAAGSAKVDCMEALLNIKFDTGYGPMQKNIFQSNLDALDCEFQYHVSSFNYHKNEYNSLYNTKLGLDSYFDQFDGGSDLNSTGWEGNYNGFVSLKSEFDQLDSGFGLDGNNFDSDEAAFEALLAEIVAWVDS